MSQEYVGCPEQEKNPEKQKWECCKLKHWKLLYELHFGPMCVDCMGEHCEVWQAFKRMQELLRQRKEASDEG